MLVARRPFRSLSLAFLVFAMRIPPRINLVEWSDVLIRRRFYSKWEGGGDTGE